MHGIASGQVFCEVPVFLDGKPASGIIDAYKKSDVIKSYLTDLSKPSSISTSVLSLHPKSASPVTAMCRSMTRSLGSGRQQVKCNSEDQIDHQQKHPHEPRRPTTVCDEAGRKGGDENHHHRARPK